MNLFFILWISGIFKLTSQSMSIIMKLYLIFCPVSNAGLLIYISLLQSPKYGYGTSSNFSEKGVKNTLANVVYFIFTKFINRILRWLLFYKFYFFLQVRPPTFFIHLSNCVFFFFSIWKNVEFLNEKLLKSQISFSLRLDILNKKNAFF